MPFFLLKDHKTEYNYVSLHGYRCPVPPSEYLRGDCLRESPEAAHGEGFLWGEARTNDNCWLRRLHRGLATESCPPTSKDAGISTPICKMGMVGLRDGK